MDLGCVGSLGHRGRTLWETGIGLGGCSPFSVETKAPGDVRESEIKHPGFPQG